MLKIFFSENFMISIITKNMFGIGQLAPVT